jgi:hypothetical protein
VRKRQANSATLNCFRARAPCAHDVAALLAPGRVGMPPYRLYTHAEAGPRLLVSASRSSAPVHDVGAPPCQATRRFPIGRTAAPPCANGGRPPHVIALPVLYSGHAVTVPRLGAQETPNRLVPAIKASPPFSRASTPSPPPSAIGAAPVSSPLRVFTMPFECA